MKLRECEVTYKEVATVRMIARFGAGVDSVTSCHRSFEHTLGVTARLSKANAYTPYTPNESR